MRQLGGEAALVPQTGAEPVEEAVKCRAELRELVLWRTEVETP